MASKLNIAQHPSPNYSGRDGTPIRMIVIHGDAGKSDTSTIAWITDPKSRVSYHFFVGRRGTIHQFVQEDQKAWHAGPSNWPDCTVAGSVNASSIGVAFANDGSEPYTPEQYKSGARLVADLCRRYDIPLHRIRGHFEVSPGRKFDPWSHFDWFTFFGELGLAR